MAERTDDAKGDARGSAWSRKSEDEKSTIRKVVGHIAANGPTAAGFSTPYDSLGEGAARSAGFIQKQQGAGPTLRHELTEKGKAAAASGDFEHPTTAPAFASKEAGHAAREASTDAARNADTMSERAYRKGGAEDHAAAAGAHREAATAHAELAKVAEHQAERDTEEGNARISTAAAKTHDAIAERKTKEAGAGGDQPRDEKGQFAGKGDALDRVQRFDIATGSISSSKRTPQGGLIARGNLTRTGVLRYVQPDGTTQRELRHPDDVFDPDSLATLAHAPLTDDHPSSVTPDNWRQVAIGHVAGMPEREGDYVAGDIHIQDAAGIRKAENGKLQELSPGYSCHVDKTPGTYNGEDFDARQKFIRYNHLAAGPAGWGRSGSDVRMRLDGGACVSGFDGTYLRPMDEAELKKQLAAAEAKAKEHADALEVARKDATDAKTEADKATAKARADAAELEKLRAENEVLKLQSSTATVKAKVDADDAKIESLAEVLTTVRADAAELIGKEFDPKGKSIQAIKREVVAALQPDWPLEGKKDSEVDVAYPIVVANAKRVSDHRGELQALTTPRSDARADGFGKGGKAPPFKKKGDDDGEPGDDVMNEDSVEGAQARMCARNKDAWKPKGDKK